VRRCLQFDAATWVSHFRGRSAPDSNDDAFALLRRMKDDLRLVSSELFGAIKQWFVARCPDWTIESSTIDDDGACVADSSIRLMAVRSLLAPPPHAMTDKRNQVDLTEAEREELANSIAQLSRARERAQDFDGCAFVAPSAIGFELGRLR